MNDVDLVLFAPNFDLASGQNVADWMLSAGY